MTIPPFYKLSIFIPLLLLLHIESTACSCILTSFCEATQEYNEVAVKVRAFRQVTYGAEDTEAPQFYDVFATYLEVLEVYKDEIQLTDTIKLYGSVNSASCEVDVHNVFPIGETVITTLSGWYADRINNPDSLTEQFSEAYPNICSMINLQVDGDMVEGFITDKRERISIRKFLNRCNLSTASLNGCNNRDIRAFPNPTPNGTVNILHPKTDDILSINVYTITGQLLNRHQVSDNTEPSTVQDVQLAAGINIIEIVGREESCWQKVVSLE